MRMRAELKGALPKGSAAVQRLHPLLGCMCFSQLGSPNNTPLLLTLQGRDHPKLHKQLDYLGKLVAATVHAMGSAAPGGQ